MPAELSTIITRLQKDGISAADSGKANAVQVAELLTPRLVPLVPEGEPVPDLVAFQLGLARLIEHERSQLEEIDASHVAELSEDRENRRQRDAGYDGLYDQLSAIQDAWTGVYVEGSAAILFDGVELLPQDPVALHRLGERVHDRLTSADFVEPEARLTGQSLDREPLAAELETRVVGLGTALAGVSRNLKDSDESLRSKRQAIDGFQRTLRFAARCFAGLYGLVGMDDLAAKVLPKRRSPRRSSAEDEGTPTDGAAAGSGETPESVSAATTADDEIGGGTPSDPPASGPLGVVS
ncbi:MAG: hypothetical protein V3T72_06375 [Thermoanaerobaculia bacterium]